jgi:Glycosyl hydrolases family 16
MRGCEPTILRDDRSGGVALQGQTDLSGIVYVFAPDGSKMRRVEFFLDDPSLSGAPRQVENNAPWDFAGTLSSALANPFDLSTLAAGSHSISARVLYRNGTTTTSTAQFSVAEPPPPSDGSPSGVPMPVGDLAGWRQVLADDFPGTTLQYGWGKYSGDIPSWEGGVWDPAHVVVRDGKLILQGYEDDGVWKTGGVMNWVQAETLYGRYEVRFRMDRANGVKYCVLLWPKSNIWPGDGEIDFAEDGGGDRSGLTATLIYSLDGTSRSQIQRYLAGEFSEWHTLGVEWGPGRLVYIVDGSSWSTVETPNTPSKPMRLAIQTETGTCQNVSWQTCRDATTPALVNMEVDWVVVYTPM